jgi:hypothetical protein
LFVFSLFYIYLSKTVETIFFELKTEGEPASAGTLHELPVGHLLHELAGLIELVHKPVHLLNGGTAAPGDALSAAGIQQVRIRPLRFGHGLDDGLGSGQLLLIHLDVAQLTGAGDHL